MPQPLTVGELEFRDGPLDGVHLCCTEPRQPIFVVRSSDRCVLARDAAGAVGVYVAEREYDREDDWECVVVACWRALPRGGSGARARRVPQEREPHRP